MCRHPFVVCAPSTICRARRAHSSAFTLVELLVVIGIIGILIGFLFPVLKKARRTAVVLASPVAYIAADSRVHLTDPGGGYDTQLLPVATNNCPVCHSPPMWSPSGQQIAMQQKDNSAEYIALLDPFAKTPTRFQALAGRNFMAWLDNSRFLVQDSSATYEVEASTGRPKVIATRSDHVFYVASAPPNAPAQFIGAMSVNGVPAVRFLKKDMSPGKVVWREPGGGGIPHQWPRVDGNGEYVGWTDTKQGMTARRIAFKHVNDPPSRPPTYIAGSSASKLPYVDLCFCDWTEQGQILANGKDRFSNEWRLIIFDKEGRFVRELQTDPPPAAGVVASYRRYGHQ